MTPPKILLIDDDRTLLDMYSLKFQLDGGCQLLTAETPGRGIELAEQIHPSLILLDLVLPKSEKSIEELNQETGFQVLEMLKKDPTTKSIPVIIFTNLDERNKDNVERAKKLGAMDYWIKARWQPSEVVQMVKAIVSPDSKFVVK